MYIGAALPGADRLPGLDDPPPRETLLGEYSLSLYMYIYIYIYIYIYVHTYHA